MSSSVKRQRESLFWKHPFCYWCGIPLRRFVVQQGKKMRMPDDAATLDHVYSRHSLDRHTGNGNLRRVLACYKCNHERGRKDHQDWVFCDMAKHNRTNAGEVTKIIKHILTLLLAIEAVMSRMKSKTKMEYRRKRLMAIRNALEEIEESMHNEEAAELAKRLRKEDTTCSP